MKKSKIIAVFVMILAISSASYWFFNKFFPTQSGEWLGENKDVFDKEIVPVSGWLNLSSNKNESSFWTSMSFPGKQNICLDIYSKEELPSKLDMQISVTQAPKAYFYPEAGTLDNLLSQMTPANIEENIKQGKSYFIGHLENNIVREGKDLFFIGENEKFLIPTKSIFSEHFPTKEIPDPSLSVSKLSYANILINLPEGTLVSDGKGVFVISQGKLFLIRSPEVFESMGYKWESIKQMDQYEKTLNSYSSGNLIDFYSAHPSGTILKNNGNLFLLWNENLYKLTSEEQSNYFLEQPVIETTEKKLYANCSLKDNSNKITCCIPNVDTRVNPPSYYPFINTLKWDTSRIIKMDKIEKIEWYSKVAVNQENTLRRLGSLKNFVLYGLGIVK